VLLTTQYLEEADRLADDIVVLDHGRTVAHGTPADLKRQIGDERIDVKVAEVAELDLAVGAVSPFASGRPTIERDLLQLTVPIQPGVRLIEVLRALDGAGIEAVDLNRRGATLDDVFLTLTGSTERPELDEVPA
jgi:ABC-2 type transport system ATP-binding protein